MGGAICDTLCSKIQWCACCKAGPIRRCRPVWTNCSNYPYGFSKEAVNGLISLSKTNRAGLLENFEKLFGASDTALPSGIANWLAVINLEASPFATTQSLIALRDADLRPELNKIKIPTVIFHGVKDRI
jgi:hypothetical protein